MKSQNNELSSLLRGRSTPPVGEIESDRRGPIADPGENARPNPNSSQVSEEDAFVLPSEGISHQGLCFSPTSTARPREAEVENCGEASESVLHSRQDRFQSLHAKIAACKADIEVFRRRGVAPPVSLVDELANLCTFLAEQPYVPKPTSASLPVHPPSPLVTAPQQQRNRQNSPSTSIVSDFSPCVRSPRATTRDSAHHNNLNFVCDPLLLNTTRRRRSPQPKRFRSNSPEASEGPAHSSKSSPHHSNTDKEDDENSKSSDVKKILEYILKTFPSSVPPSSTPSDALFSAFEVAGIDEATVSSKSHLA